MIDASLLDSAIRFRKAVAPAERSTRCAASVRGHGADGGADRTLHLRGIAHVQCTWSSFAAQIVCAIVR
jgi:hypothetical protein